MENSSCCFVGDGGIHAANPARLATAIPSDTSSPQKRPPSWPLSANFSFVCVLPHADGPISI